MSRHRSERKCVRSLTVRHLFLGFFSLFVRIQVSTMALSNKFPSIVADAFVSFPARETRSESAEISLAFVSFRPSTEMCHCNRPKQQHPNVTDGSLLNERWQLARHTAIEPRKEQGVCPLNGSPVRGERIDRSDHLSCLCSTSDATLKRTRRSLRRFSWMCGTFLGQH